MEDNYLELPIQNPGNHPVVTGAGSGATYTANDCSAADVDGDGEYEILVKWYPSNQFDSASGKLSSPTIFDCYKLDGTALWRIKPGIDVQLRTSEHRSMYSYVRLSIDRCTATYV